MSRVYLRRYGEATTVNFELWETDGTDLKIDAAHASGDTTIMKDEGTEANTTNGFTDEGKGYSIALTATEMQAARIVVYVVDQSTKVWLDKALVIETYGHPSAQHPEMGIKLPVFGTAQAGAAATVTLPTTAVATDDYYNGGTVYIVGGTGIGQTRSIVDYVGSTKVATIDPAWVTNPDNTSVIVVLPSAPAPTGLAYLPSVDVESVNRSNGLTGDGVTTPWAPA